MVGEPPGEGGVALVAGQVGTVEGGAEAGPVAIVADGDGDPVVIAPAGVDPVGSHVGVAVADAAGDAARELGVEQPGAEEVERTLDL